MNYQQQKIYTAMINYAMYIKNKPPELEDGIYVIETKIKELSPNITVITTPEVSVQYAIKRVGCISFEYHSHYPIRIDMRNDHSQWLSYESATPKINKILKKSWDDCAYASQVIPDKLQEIILDYI